MDMGRLLLWVDTVAFALQVTVIRRFHYQYTLAGL
mgnify:FL=1